MSTCDKVVASHELGPLPQSLTAKNLHDRASSTPDMPKTLDSWLIPAKAAAPGGSSEQSLDPVQAPATAAAPQANINLPSVAAPAALATPEAPLRGSVIAFAGWKGAEDELADLRNEILSAGGRLETFE